MRRYISYLAMCATMLLGVGASAVPMIKAADADLAYADGKTLYFKASHYVEDSPNSNYSDFLDETDGEDPINDIADEFRVRLEKWGLSEFEVATQGYDTIAVTKRVFAWGLAYMVIMLVVTGDAFPLAVLAEPTVLGNLAFLGILASAGCFVTWGYSVKHLGATAASAYIYLQAPITVIWAVILLGEPLTAAIVVGLALVIVGLALSEGFHIRKREL